MEARRADIQLEREVDSLRARRDIFVADFEQKKEKLILQRENIDKTKYEVSLVQSKLEELGIEVKAGVQASYKQTLKEVKLWEEKVAVYKKNFYLKEKFQFSEIEKLQDYNETLSQQMDDQDKILKKQNRKLVDLEEKEWKFQLKERQMVLEMKMLEQEEENRKEKEDLKGINRSTKKKKEKKIVKFFINLEFMG